MILKEFGSFLSQICTHSPLAEGRPLIWTIIANPIAGGFTIRSRWKKHYTILRECARKALNNPVRKAGPSQTALSEGEETGNLGLVLTKRKGHAGDIIRKLVKEVSAGTVGVSGVKPFYLIITAGGDGTSLETQTCIFHASPELRENMAILRLPMGTGNDGSDAWELDQALLLLMEPAEVYKQRALMLRTASGKGPYLAFNILSVGLDAFVTHMTNRMKGSLPGDSYKLWVDVAAMFYDRIYKVGYMDVRSRDGTGKEVKAFREKVLLLAMGESGRRTYGSHNWILPDDRNVCAMRQMSLLRKLALKGPISNGTHIDKPEAMLWNAAAVEFTPEFPLLAQMDGETVLLKEGDFPAVIELTGPVIPILRSKNTPHPR